MALISSGGGRLRVSAPHLPHGLGASTFGGPTPKPPRVAVPRVHAAPKVKTPVVKPPSTAKTAGGDPNDPFTFIKGLLASTDPTAIRGLIDPIYAPLRQQVQDQISQLDATGKARADQMSQIYQEFEQYLGGLPGQIQSIYGQKGAQDGATLAAGMAGPQGDVASHLQALSNSDLMTQLGANWAAYAAAQPHIYALMATENIKGMLNATNASEATLRSKLLDLSSQEADAVLKYLEDAQAKDASLQQWAYTQKQSQTAAKANQAQAYLNYLQKQRQIDFNNSIVEGKLSLAQAKASADANYKAQLLQLKQAGLIDQAQYHQALIGLGTQRVGIAQQNANTAVGRAQIAQQNANTASGRAATAAKNANRNYQLAQRRYALSQQRYQQTKANGMAKTTDKVSAARAAAAKYAQSLKAKQTVVSSTSTTVKKGVSTHTTQRAYTYARHEIWSQVYNTYAADFFNYFRALYPKTASTPGAMQKLVDQAISMAVGWGRAAR